MSNERVPPHNIEAEISILGSIMMDYNYCIGVIDNVKPEYFYKDSHQYIYTCILELHKNGKQVDMPAIIEELKKINKLDKAGGAYYVSELTESAPSSANIKQHIKIVKDNYDLRRFILLARKIEYQAYNHVNPDKIREETSEMLINNYDSEIKIVDKNSIVTERKKGLIERIDSKLIATGYPSIDKYLSVGFSPCKGSIITARPRTGKSVYKSNLTVNMCKLGLSVLHVTPEQGFDAEMDRLTSIISGVPLMDIIKMKNWASVKDGRITAPDNKVKLKKIIDATKEIESWNIHFLSGVVNLSKMRRAIIETKMKYGLDVVFVDLFDRVEEVREETHNKAQKVTQCLGKMQKFEEEFNIHICNLVQTRRSAEQRKDKRPMLSDLKESGSFEEEAWTIFGIHREALYDDDLPDNYMEIIIMKQRQGPCDKIELRFDKDTLTLYDQNEGEF